MSKLELIGGIPRMRPEAANPVIYDETTSIASPISTGTPITLPSSQTYNSDELEVYLNGNRVEDTIDYMYEGTAPRTQISFTFDLIVGDKVRFRIDRGV